ncbi:hypothetical protein CRU98_11375 [Arcobacter sp. CECT 8986]|uniref:hypothetical protein n=1 Tax=Arcobacter sp. CECT 8986 TaxID=2044507 RepID=UPI001009D401|nr:hypothetical protein [Arcobacter sp. CECT 8986]RXJ98110.1 hypothetical protein CRU98_11375 [Arcobacter sp. CECT 8986]
MLKIVLAIFFAAFLSYAATDIETNDTEQVEEIPAISLCDKVYDDCALKCEDSDDKDNAKCYANCEKLYEKCLEENTTEQTEEK